MGGRLIAGTSSWTEKAWNGSFYPAGVAAGEQLAYYATQFESVEADVTYYRVPDRKLVAGWAAKTPAGFRLSAKFPRSIVHGGATEKPDASRVLMPEVVGGDTQGFLEAMSLLGAKCGPLVLQFPYFNQGAFASSAPFLERLDAYLAGLPSAFRYAVELRNKAWIGEPLLQLLRRHRAALVWVDLAYMPHPADLAREHDLVTTDFVYARLIGDRAKIDGLTERLDRIVLDQSGRLLRWAELLRETLQRVPEAYVYANNHYAGFAPETIRDLARRVAAP
jgi:uncharacterized protein YecE (DUF72 family)